MVTSTSIDNWLPGDWEVYAENSAGPFMQIFDSERQLWVEYFIGRDVDRRASVISGYDKKKYRIERTK